MSRTIVVVNEGIIAWEKRSKALKCKENVFPEDFSAEKRLKLSSQVTLIQGVYFSSIIWMSLRVRDVDLERRVVTLNSLQDS